MSRYVGLSRDAAYPTSLQAPRIDGRSELEQLKAKSERLTAENHRIMVECAWLRAQGRHIRATTHRLWLDCLKARLDLAERLDTVAFQSGCEKLAALYTAAAMKSCQDVRAAFDRLGWTAMDRSLCNRGWTGLRGEMPTGSRGPESTSNAQGPVPENALPETLANEYHPSARLAATIQC